MTEQERTSPKVIDANPEDVVEAPSAPGNGGLRSADVRKGRRKIEGDKSYIDALTDKFKGRVFGQDGACLAMAQRIAIAEAGLGEKHKPLGVFFYLGPTGTGKVPSQ